MKGLFSALLIPFDENGEIQEAGLRQIVRQNIDVQEVDGLYVNGSSGENFLMSTEQKREVFRIVADEVQGEIKLIAQIGSLDLKEAIALGKYATSLGYDSLSAVTPFYYKFSFEEIKAYYDTIIAETNNNMIIYAIPALTGVSMDMEQFDALFENEKVIGVKYTDGNFFLLERLRKRYPNKLIYSGFDEMLIYGVISGVDGAIGSTFNVNGKRSKEIMNLCHAGKVAEAYEVQHTTNDVIEKILELGLYQTLKEILRQKGYESGVCKAPLQAFDPQKEEEVAQLITDYQL